MQAGVSPATGRRGSPAFFGGAVQDAVQVHARHGNGRKVHT